MQPAIYNYWATYGVQTDFRFATQDVTDVDDLYAGTAWAASDASISKDGGAEAATTNTPARITALIHKITLTATEMQASQIFVVIRDQTEPEVFEPVALNITTRATLGSLAIDTTAIGGNVSAVSATGVGTGNGFTGTAGASGLICNFFDTVMTSQPTTAFASTDTYGKSLARLFRRFYNKVTQSSTQQIQYRDDSTTALDTMTVSDDGLTQTKGKSA